jgi:hypothetical protein
MWLESIGGATRVSHNVSLYDRRWWPPHADTTAALRPSIPVRTIRYCALQCGYINMTMYVRSYRTCLMKVACGEHGGSTLHVPKTRG